MVDALSGLKALVIMGEVEEVVGRFLFQLFGAMLGTENRTRVGNGEAASAAAGRAMGATNGKGNGVSRLWFHFFPHEEARGTPTPGGFWQRVRKRLKINELRFARVQKCTKECTRV